MLTEKERYRCLQAISFICIVGMLPARVNLRKREFHIKLTRLEKLFSCISFAAHIVHTVYVTWRLFRVVCFAADVPLYHLIIHFNVVVAAVMITVYYYMLYIRGDKVHVFLMTAMFGKPMGNQVNTCGGSKKRGLARLTEYSLQDLDALLLPYAAATITAALMVTFIYEPGLKFLVWSALPENWRSNWSFALCMMEEARYFFSSLAIVVPVFQVQVVGLETFNNVLEVLMSSISKRKPFFLLKYLLKEARSDYLTLRWMQLYVILWNSVHRYLIFLWKLLSLWAAISYGYAAIAHFRDHPVFGVMYYVLFINITLIYAVMYGKGFEIPGRFEQVRRLMLMRLRSGQNQRTLERLVLERQIRSIPALGIQVGEFHTLERHSTPTFIDCVIQNIVNMLVSF